MVDKTPQQQIDKLVEKVATGIELSMCAACRCTGEECEGCTWLPAVDCKKTARQILFNNNLAKIDKDKLKTNLQCVEFEYSLGYHDAMKQVEAAITYLKEMV